MVSCEASNVLAVSRRAADGGEAAVWRLSSRRCSGQSALHCKEGHSVGVSDCPAVCQLYMPFNKSILALVPFRMEYGRESPKLFDRWVSDLQSISKMRIHQIFSQTVSDIAHVKYFTGVTATYLPSVCMHVGTTYFPWRSEISCVGH